MPFRDAKKPAGSGFRGTSARPSTAVDVAKSAGTGAGQGVLGFRGISGDVSTMLTSAGQGVIRRVVPGEGGEAGAKAFGGFMELMRNTPKIGPLNNALYAPTTQQLSQATGLTYRPQTTAGRYAHAVGVMAPNAVMGPAGARGVIGQVVGRSASVIVPGVASEGAADAVRAMGGGRGAQTAARVVGGVAGGVGAGVRVPQRAPQVAEASALRKLTRQAPQDAALVTQRAAEFQANGIIPTLTDVVDEAGRGVIRSAASRMTPARTEAVEYAEATANALPGRMSTQARTHLSADPRTPAAIAAGVARQRKAQADTNYGAVRGDAISMAPETVAALRTGHGQDAIKAAIQGERNPDVRAALARLTADALDDPSTRITVGMADSIARSLYGQAKATADNNLASIFSGLADDIRNPARAASPGYAAAVDDFAAESRILRSAERGEDYLVRDTDAFVADLAANGPDGLPLARASARRAVERASGENVSAAPGVARRIATAPEVQARTRALMSEPEAQAFERAMQLEAERVSNARYIDPKSGSPTQGRGQDALQTAGEATAALAQVGPHPVGAMIAGAKLWLKGQGLNNREAEALTRMAIDPAQATAAMARLQQRLGQARAQAFLRVLAQPGTLALTTSAAAQPAEQ